MKGFILLSEVRSGTSWLCSMANATGKLGLAREWLNPDSKFFQSNLLNKRVSSKEHLEQVIQQASTDNNRFAIKIFPRHLRYTIRKYGYDFIQQSRKQHDVSFALLTRKDRLRQAISATRAHQTKSWSSMQKKEREEYFDYAFICKNLLLIEQSYAFWRSYLTINNIEYKEFDYEQIGLKHQLYIKQIADALSVKINLNETPVSKLKKQRDQTTEEWVDRFNEMAGKVGVLEITDELDIYPRTLKNVLRLLRKQRLSTKRSYPPVFKY